jgi:hypothetical protein
MSWMRSSSVRLVLSAGREYALSRVGVALIGVSKKNQTVEGSKKNRQAVRAGGLIEIGVCLQHRLSSAGD